MRNGYLLIVCLCLLPTIGTAQTSVGFTDPEDIQTLLDYRLPDWSYRTFDARMALDGRAQSTRNSGQATSGANFQGSLGLGYLRHWESETRNLEYGGTWTTDYLHGADEFTESESSLSRYNNRLSLDGSYERYLGGGPVSLRGTASLDHHYGEEHRDRSDADETVEENFYTRTLRLRAAAGVGVGRLRNVRPLLQAKRLSERLQALGRPALSPQQVRRMAEVIATEYGYGLVFDRPERFFWEDVFKPLVPMSEPLSPYEILYLQEALNENLGNRYEGLRLSANANWSEDNQSYLGLDVYRHTREIYAAASYYHNPTLTRQYRAHLSGNYRWRKSGPYAEEYGYLRASVGHLWNVTDRLLWEVGLNHNGGRQFEPRTDYFYEAVTSDFEFQIEDRLFLNCGVDLRYNHTDRSDDVDFLWDLVYNVGLSYNLGASLLN